MPRWNRIFQANFTKGEFDPKLWSRGDTKLYSQGARHVLNGHLLPQGGFTLRPGTLAVAALILTGPVRLFGWAFAPDEEYLVVFEPGKFRVYDNLSNLFIIEVGSMPWTTASMPQLCAVAAEGTIIVTHESFWPIRIMRHGKGVILSDIYPFERAPNNSAYYAPYVKFAPSPMTIQSTYVGLGATQLFVNAPYWSTHHVGCYIRIRIPPDPVAGTVLQVVTFYIDSVVDNQTVNAHNLGPKPLPNLTPVTTWDEQAFSPVWGYPRAVGFEEQRIVFAGHPAAPGLIMMSQSGAPYNFDTGSGADNEAIIIYLTTENTNQIRALIAGQHFVVLTNNGPFYCPASDQNPMTPANCGFRRTAAPGSNWTPAIMYDQAIVYIQVDASQVREMVYDLYRMSYTADPISLLSAHLLNAPIELHTKQGDASNPNTYLYIVNADGTVAVYLGIRAQDVAGWVPWTIAGQVQSMAAIGDALWIQTKRVIGGRTVYALEKFDPSQVMDSCQSYVSATAKTLWGPYSYWVGATVGCYGDGYWLGTFTFDASGNLQLPQDKACKNLTVGIPFDRLWQTMSLDAALQDGPLLGRPRTMASCVVQMKDTMDITVNGQRLWPYQQHNLNQPPTLHQGAKEVYLRGWSREAIVTIQQSYPSQVTIESISTELAG